MIKDNVFEDLGVRTHRAQWAVKKAREIVNNNTLQAQTLAQKVVDNELTTAYLTEENVYQNKDLWNKVKKMLLQ